jgi:hypothetical protein
MLLDGGSRSSVSSLPRLGIPMLVKDREHARSVAHDREIDAVRKHSNQRTTYIWLDDLILARVVRYRSDDAVYLFLEAEAEVRTLELVRNGRVADVRLG